MRSFRLTTAAIALLLLYSCATDIGEGTGSTDTQTSTAESPSEKEAAIQSYLDSLTFLTYFSDTTNVDPFLMRSAAGVANRYLVENGVGQVDLEIVEKNKRDQELAYEDQEGGALSLIRWIARKLNADVYLEIYGETSSGSIDGRYFGRANITLNFFDLATGELITSAASRSPETFSSSSELDAVNSAIQSTVLQLMPAVVEQVHKRLEKKALNGIPYELVIRTTPDTRLMDDFIRGMQSSVEKIQVVSRSPEEARYRVFLLGSVDDLQSIVFDTADVIPALQNLELVYIRGSSLTFASGL